VALLFLFLDVVHLSPLATPNALAAGLFHPAGYEYDTGLMNRIAGWVGTGFHLLTYTVLHFATFAALGVVATLILGRAGWLASLVGGGLFGLTACTAVFYASRLVLDTPVVVESFGTPALLLANGLAGVILGAGVYLGRTPDPAEAGDASAS
jgi:hypothetical protein